MIWAIQVEKERFKDDRTNGDGKHRENDGSWICRLGFPFYQICL